MKTALIKLPIPGEPRSRPASGQHPWLLGLALALAGTLTVCAQQYAIDWSSLDGGGGTSTGGAYALTGVIGQPDAGRSSGGTFLLEGGFLSATAGTVPPPPVTIRIALTSSNTVLVAWPAPSTGLALRENPALGTAPWLDVTNVPVVVGNENQVIISPSNGSRFYRLERK